MKYCLTSDIIVKSCSPFHDDVVTETFSSIMTDTPLLLQDIHTVRQTKPKYRVVFLTGPTQKSSKYGTGPPNRKK